MQLLRKVYQRLTDPIFYRKRTRNFLRSFRKFPEEEWDKSTEVLAGIESAVVVVAHPDDEVFCSGLLCELKRRGARLRVLCLTKGEGGPSAGHPREKLGQIRAEEMKDSCDILGVDDLVFLGHVDPEGKGYRVFAPEVSSSSLAEQILPHLRDCDLVVSHGSSGEYWHPAHLLIFEAVREASGACPGRPAWMSLSARRPDHPLPELVNWDDPAFLTLDGSRYEKTRLRALDCHRTQLSLFSKFAHGNHIDFIRYTAREAYALQRGGAKLNAPGGESA